VKGAVQRLKGGPMRRRIGRNRRGKGEAGGDGEKQVFHGRVPLLVPAPTMGADT
jgi:hypothetical protein